MMDVYGLGRGGGGTCLYDGALGLVHVWDVSIGDDEEDEVVQSTLVLGGSPKHNNTHTHSN